MNISEIRTLFPVTQNSVYLNNAAESPLNVRVRQRLEEYLTLASERPHEKPPVREPVRTALAELCGGSSENYALVTSTGVGIGIVAAGYDWRKGDNVVVPADEHWNNTFPWLALRRRGVDVRLVPVDEDQRIDPNKVASLVDENTRILATTAVRFNTGFRADLPLLSTIAHDKGALFVVDGIQNAGVCPMDVGDMGIDIHACAGFKWLLGTPGTGFLFVNKAAQEKIEPVLPGMSAAVHSFRELDYHPDARQYETGTMAYSLFHAWLAGLELLKEVGVANIHARVLELTDRIIAGLRERNCEIVSPVEDVGERSAIIAFTMGSETVNTTLQERLATNGISTALRDGRVRVSPNFFNTEDEIDMFLEVLGR
jgi:cysteine desulfurase/selenocysteine lyase